MRLPAPLTGVLTFVLMLAALLFVFALLFPGVVLKALVPIPAVRRAATLHVLRVANLWTHLNAGIYRLLQDVRWQLDIDGEIVPGRSYLLICNHQSWADILVLADAIRGRTWFPRFFLKHELIWVPVIGMACWALDMPFMRRHSREAVARNPQLREDDLRTTRAFCEKYRREPITAVNFLEGTRYTPEKHRRNPSPYRHLLRPKSAGLSFTLNAMGEQFAGLIDMTIAYAPATGRGGIVWSWLCGRQRTLAVHIQVRPIPPAMIHGDYERDAGFRAGFQAWVNDLWAAKDERLERLQARVQAAAERPASAERPA